jgi:hypothetical protein
MTESKRKLAATLIAAALTTDVTVSTRPAPGPGAGILRVEPREAPAGQGRARRTIGFGRVLEDGVPLNVGVWGGGGAVIGSLAGPPGAIIGAGAGALAGLLYSAFAVPHNGPEPRPK